MLLLGRVVESAMHVFGVQGGAGHAVADARMPHGEVGVLALVHKVQREEVLPYGLEAALLQEVKVRERSTTAALRVRLHTHTRVTKNFQDPSSWAME